MNRKFDGQRKRAAEKLSVMFPVMLTAAGWSAGSKHEAGKKNWTSLASSRQVNATRT